MRHTAPLLALSALLVVGAIAGCSSGGGSGGTASGDLVVHDDPVAAGTPVMYEFFTET